MSALQRTLQLLLLHSAALAAAEEPQKAAAPAAARSFAEGWVAFKGTLKVGQEAAGEKTGFSGTLEVAYLGLGAASAPAEGAGGEEVLLLRTGESPESQEMAFSEAVTLTVRPGFEARARFPIEDRAARVSPLPFTYLPLWIFPPPGDPARREWKENTRLPVLFHEPQALSCVHRRETGAAGSISHSVEAERGQKLAFLRDRMEVGFEVEELRQVHKLVDGRLVEFRSSLRGRFLDVAGARLVRELVLVRSEASALEGERGARLLGDGLRVREIERALFSSFDVETAESRASAFARERAESRLARFAAGLGHQADAVRPIARERKLYGKPAPDFTLIDLAGKPVALSRAAPGKVTLLSFWSVG